MKIKHIDSLLEILYGVISEKIERRKNFAEHTAVYQIYTDEISELEDMRELLIWGRGRLYWRNAQNIKKRKEKV